MKSNIYPCLWFDGQAKAAAEFYCSVFADSKLTVDTPMVVNFELAGQKFMGLNGGPQFKANPSISFFVVCESIEEVDKAWEKLSEDGMVMMALDKYDWSERYGFLQDKFGISWQISMGKISDVGQKFTPTLMFTKEKAGRAEEAVNFYTSVFKSSSVAGIARYEEGEGDVTGTVKHAQFTLDGYVMMAMDSSGPHAFSFNEAISLVVTCADQDQINYFWNGLTAAGGSESMCGWLKDKFGVFWQIIPANLGKLMSAPGKGHLVGQALMQMKKIDIKKLEEAAA